MSYILEVRAKTFTFRTFRVFAEEKEKSKVNIRYYKYYCLTVSPSTNARFKRDAGCDLTTISLSPGKLLNTNASRVAAIPQVSIICYIDVLLNTKVATIQRYIPYRRGLMLEIPFCFQFDFRRRRPQISVVY